MKYSLDCRDCMCGVEQRALTGALFILGLHRVTRVCLIDLLLAVGVRHGNKLFGCGGKFNADWITDAYAAAGNGVV